MFHSPNECYQIRQVSELPSHLSRKKRWNLRGLKEKILMVIIAQGWKKWNMLSGGKEVLLKAILRTLCLVSNCQKGFCDDISMVMARFLWGLSLVTRKIHWSN